MHCSFAYYALYYASLLLFVVNIFVTGFWKTDQNVTLGLFYFIVQLIVTLIHYPCTVALTGLADWSAFLRQVLQTM